MDICRVISRWRQCKIRMNKTCIYVYQKYYFWLHTDIKYYPLTLGTGNSYVHTDESGTVQTFSYNQGGNPDISYEKKERQKKTTNKQTNKKTTRLTNQPTKANKAKNVCFPEKCVRNQINSPKCQRSCSEPENLKISQAMDPDSAS